MNRILAALVASGWKGNSARKLEHYEKLGQHLVDHGTEVALTNAGVVFRLDDAGA